MRSYAVIRQTIVSGAIPNIVVSTIFGPTNSVSSELSSDNQYVNFSTTAEQLNLHATTVCCVIIQKYSTFIIFNPTQPIENCKISTQPNLIQPNPTRGSTQLMDNCDQVPIGAQN